MSMMRTADRSLEVIFLLTCHALKCLMLFLEKLTGEKIICIPFSLREEKEQEVVGVL